MYTLLKGDRFVGLCVVFEKICVCICVFIFLYYCT